MIKSAPGIFPGAVLLHNFKEALKPASFFSGNFSY